jgi:glycosyltransferase involved in cell wall biosynthesis
MRIAIATPLYPPEIGGPATYASLLERVLPERGINISIIPFSVVRSTPKFLRHAAYAFKVMRVASSHDGILALDAISVGVPAWVASVLLRKPLLVRVGGIGTWERVTERNLPVGMPHELLDDLPRLPLAMRILARIERFVLTHAKTVVVPSAYLKRALVAVGVPEERIEVVYNTAGEIGSEHDFPEVPLVIGAGRFVALKRFDVLIAAIGKLAHGNPAIRLELYGSGPSEDELRRLVNQDPMLARSVQILPALPQEELHARIRGASVFALPSTHETFSHLIIEAMALGTPVVATDTGGNPEIITGGKSGLLVPVGDAEGLAKAIETILGDASLARRIAREGLVAAQTFSEERMLTATERVLRSALP